MARRLASFTVDREPIEVPIGGEVFVAHPLLAPAVLGKILDKQGNLGALAADGASQQQAIDQVLDVIGEVFDLMLVPESAARFRARLTSTGDAFDLHREVLPALTALVEEYTARPTQPSSPSTTGPATNGGASTAGAPATELTLSLSPQTASAT